jgi:hypothetical protein
MCYGIPNAYNFGIMTPYRCIFHQFYYLDRVNSSYIFKTTVETSKVEHNPFQEAAGLSICSTFQLNVMSRTMLCNAALMVRLSNFHSSFKPNFSRIFLFEFQVVRESNRSTFEGPPYQQRKLPYMCNSKICKMYH